MDHQNQSQNAPQNSHIGQHEPTRNWQAMLHHVSALFQSLETQVYQLKRGAATQMQYWEQQNSHLQVELESERRNGETIKQQLIGTEEHLKRAISDAESQRNRISVLEESARKIAKDAEMVILESQTTPIDGQIMPTTEGCIAQILFESGHNAAMLRMRQQLDSCDGSKAAEMLHKLGKTNLDSQVKIERIRKKREQAILENTALRGDNAALSQRIVETENELAALRRDIDADPALESEKPLRKKRKTRSN